MDITKTFRDIKVYGGDDRIPGVTDILVDGQVFKLGELEIQAISTPGHTTSSICYNVFDPSTNERVVFTGDTLFVGGCGRFFEGGPKDMHSSLLNKLAKLPRDTKVYCGHEYTKNNLEFAKSIEPSNSKIIEKLNAISDTTITVPSTIGDELEFNPFMRVETEELRKATKITDAVELMKYLRETKNKF